VSNFPKDTTALTKSEICLQPKSSNNLEIGLNGSKWIQSLKERQISGRIPDKSYLNLNREREREREGRKEGRRGGARKAEEQQRSKDKLIVE
jgi:hypothetical protein